MWGNAKRKRNGKIYLTRNNDGLSRWRDKSAQSLFNLLSLQGIYFLPNLRVTSAQGTLIDGYLNQPSTEV